MELIVVCALVAGGVLALAFADVREGAEGALAGMAGGTAGVSEVFGGMAQGAQRAPAGPIISVVEIGSAEGFPLQIRDFEPETDRIELDLDRASFGDTVASDLAIVPDPAQAATQLVIAGQVVAVVHGTTAVHRDRVAVFAI